MCQQIAGTREQRNGINQMRNIIEQVTPSIRIVEIVSLEESSTGYPIYAVQEKNIVGNYMMGKFESTIHSARNRAQRLADQVHPEFSTTVTDLQNA